METEELLRAGVGWPREFPFCLKCTALIETEPTEHFQWTKQGSGQWGYQRYECPACGHERWRFVRR